MLLWFLSENIDCYWVLHHTPTPEYLKTAGTWKVKKLTGNFFPVFIALEPHCVPWGRGKCPLLLCAICTTVVKSSYSSWLKWGCSSSCTKLTILSLKPAVPLELTFFFFCNVITILSTIQVKILWNLSVSCQRGGGERTGWEHMKGYNL